MIPRTPEEAARLAAQQQAEMRSYNNWNTLQAAIGIPLGVALVGATGPGRGPLAYGAGALFGYFIARKLVLPV